MTTLEPKTIRDAHGIDTFERGLVYAALLLRSSNISLSNTSPAKTNKYFNAVRIIANFAKQSTEGVESSLSIQAKLPYQSQEALVEGGNFIENLGVFNNSEPPSFSVTCVRQQPIPFAMPHEPIWVDTLERYLAWCAHKLINGYLIKYPDQTPPVTSDFLEEESEPSLLIKAIIEIDTFVYLQRNNLVCAVVKTIGSAADKSGNDATIGNLSVFDNLNIIGN